MTRAATAALGLGQCVNWGVLYYAFPVLVLPLQRELGVGTWVVTGAFSLALLASALFAPIVGRWGDRGGGALMMLAGGVTAAALMILWTLTSTVWTLYIVWAGLGLCMAATLYEPAFVIVGRAYLDPVRRLRALGAITLLGGLASTVFLPLTAVLLGAVGWRSAVVVLALILAASAGFTHVCAFRSLPAPSGGTRAADFPDRPSDGDSHSRRFSFITMTFALASLASAAFTANLVPALGERGVSPSTAAVLGGVIGVMQLPGRALLMSGMLSGSPSGLLAVTVALHAAGLSAVAFGPSIPVVTGGTMVLGLGAGLTALVRPYLVQTMFDYRRGGHLNGRIARHQQLARAAGPLAVAWLAGIVGYATVFTVIAAMFALLALFSRGVLGSSRGVVIDEQTV